MKRIMLLLLPFCITVVLFSKDFNSKNVSSLKKASGEPFASLININRLAAWYASDGQQERNPVTGNSGLTYPRMSSTSIYASGLLWGGKVNDGITPVIRVNGTSYSTGIKPGAILGIRTGVVEDLSDPEVRIWRIRRDYAVADLSQDAAEFFMKPLESITQTDIDKIRGQYKTDWEKWPASKGAPFYDANNDGIYTPQFEVVGDKEVPKIFPAADEPGLANADQVIWFVANDINWGSPWASPDVGMEMQTTVWGYNRSGNLGEIIFKKFKLIYKGTASTPANATITDMYLTNWSDPDLGDPGDDYVGCDTLLSLGYVYNSTSVDKEYKKYSMPPPAFGYDFLQGPTVQGGTTDTAIIDLKKRSGFKNLPMTSFIYFAAGGLYTDPQFIPLGGDEWYQMMQGYPPRPPGAPLFIDPVSGQPTKYWLSGDPIARTGWVDGISEGAGDRRFLQNSGPFTMAVGDTQEIVVGAVGGTGSDRLLSILKMKENDRYVQTAYNSLFSFIPPGFASNVSYPNASQAQIQLLAFAAVSQINSINVDVITRSGTKLISSALYDDGAHGDSLALDGIYGAQITITRQASPVSINTQIIDKSSKVYTINKVLETITVAGLVEVSSASVFYDNINGDGIVNNGEYVRYGVSIKNNSTFNLKKVDAYPVTQTDVATEAVDISTGAEYTQSNSDAQFVFRLPLGYSEPSYTIQFVIKDSTGNYWNSSYTFPVFQQSFISDSLVNVATNIVGNNDAQVGYVLYNPSISGQKIDIWFGGRGTSWNWTAVDNIPNSDYATVTATFSSSNVIPLPVTLSNANGTGSFTINDAENQISYTINVAGLTGAITSAHFHVGAALTTGSQVKTLNFTGNTATGIWSRYDLFEPFADSLVKYFTAGNLYVVINTAAYPTGEIRGQIADGLLPRTELPLPYFPLPSLFSYEENRLTGFSLYVSPAPIGTKSVNQIEPTFGNVLSQINPEGTYQIIGPKEYLFGLKFNELPIEIRFNNGINYAAAVRGDTINPPARQVQFIKVPFAVYIDTVRVWPVVRTQNLADTTWDLNPNEYFNGKPIFDRILGVANTNAANGTDIRYFGPYPVFPPTSTVTKANISNGVNHVVKDIVFVNEKGDGSPPANGTKVLFTQYQPIKIGDVKSITLNPLGVEEQLTTTLPREYSLSQNYPNPFNPTTKIDFALPQSGRATLKIYDILGREITTLVNEQLNAGKYSVQLNAARFASGVYFYRIVAGNFVKTKKMILLK